jgi:cobalt-zinc-cadmium efflux system outer membrane protein
VLDRADVRAALQRIGAADAALELAMAQRKRDITVGLQVEHNGSNTPLNSVGFGISVPLMTGYEYEGEIAHAQADARTAADALAQVRAQAYGEVAVSYSDLSAAAARIERYDGDLLQTAKRALDASEFGYKHGALSLTDLLDARRTYKATLIETTQARADYAKALAAWNLTTRPATTPPLSSHQTPKDMQSAGTTP